MIQAQIERIDKLEQQHILPKEELITLLDGQNEALSAYLFSRADAVQQGQLRYRCLRPRSDRVHQLLQK